MGKVRVRSEINVSILNIRLLTNFVTLFQGKQSNIEFQRELGPRLNMGAVNDNTLQKDMSVYISFFVYQVSNCAPCKLKIQTISVNQTFTDGKAESGN